MPIIAPLANEVTGRSVSRRLLRVMISLVLVALAVRTLSLVGYQGRDDRNYLAYAQYVASGQSIATLDIQNQWVGRVGFWIPTAVAMRLFGLGQMGYVAYPLLTSLLGVVLTFALASLTVGARAGALAAVFLAFFPLDVLYATRAYPDVPLGMLMVAGYWLALKGRTSVWFAGLGGLTLGVAYLHKETALFALVPIGIALRCWRTQHWRALAVLTLGIALVIGAELAFWTTIKGDPLYRFHATDAALSAAKPEPPAARGGWLSWIPGPRSTEAYRSKNTLLDAALMLSTNEELVLLYWLVLPMLVNGAIKKDAETKHLRLWILVLLPMIVFLPVVPPYYTIPRDPRYLTCLTVPALLILASYLLRLPSGRRVIVIAAFLATSALGILLGKESSRMEPQLTLLERTRQGERLWVSPQFAADLIFLSGVDPDVPLGIHLLQQGKTAGSFEAALLVRPHLPVAEGADQITDGLLVLREQRQMPTVHGWAASERIAPRASWPVRQVQRILGTLHLQAFAGKLDPGGGVAAVIYRRSTPQTQ